MKKIFALMAVLIFMLSTNVFAEERLPVISVSGEGIVETSPDRATISVGVVTRDRDAAKVQSESAKIANDIINSVVGLGVERKNIRTGNYSFQQIFRHDDKNKRIFDGYEVNNTVTITVDNLNLVGKVIDTSLSRGANRIDSLQFGLRDKTNLQSEALRLAVRDARAKADVVARELGKNIVGVRSVSIHSAPITAPRYAKLAVAMEDSANFETPIEAGSMSCSASVNVEFEIN